MAEASIREIAESIARRGIPYSWLNNEDDYRAALNWFANEIESALNNERQSMINLFGNMLLRFKSANIRSDLEGSEEDGK